MFRDFGEMWRGLPRFLQQDGDSMFIVPSDRACFLDGGGKLKEQRVIAYCGYVTHPYAMQEFEQTWNFLVNTAGLGGVGLHMTDAMSWSGAWSRNRAAWGEGAESKRAEFIKAFANCIQRSSLRGFGCVADSQFISEKGQESIRPDLVLFGKAMEKAVAAMPPDGRLTVFCDWEDGFDLLCCKLLAKLRIQRPEIGKRIVMLAFGDDTAYAQLQAADMFAYCACKEEIRRRDTPERPVDPVFSNLTDPNITTVDQQPMAEMIDGDAFRRMVEAHR